MPFVELNVRMFPRFSDGFRLPLLNEGLILVEGANGSGKSTAVVETLTWCLYDRLVRLDNRQAGNAIGGAADVSVLYRKGERLLDVNRKRGAKGSPRLTVTDDLGQPVPLSKDPNVRTDDVAELLGIDYTLLRAAVVVGSVSLAQSGFAAQMSVLESVLNLAELGGAQGSAAQEASVVSSEVTVAKATRDLRQQALQDAETALAGLGEDTTAEEETALKTGIQHAEQAVTRLGAIRALFPGHEQSESSTRDALVKVEADRTRVRQELRTHQGQAPTACAACRRPYADAEEIAQANVQRAQHRDVLQTALTALDVTWTAASNDARIAAEVLRQSRQEERELAVLAARAAPLAEHLAQLARHREQLQAQREAAEGNVTIARTRLDESEVQVRETTWAHWRHAFWSKEYGRDAMQADVFANWAPMLNQYADAYSRSVTGGQFLVQFNPHRTNRNEDLIRISGDCAPTYDLSSGGQRQRINLIIALSLRALARSRLAEPLNVSVWDEAFEKIDELGVATVMRVLQAELQHGGTTLVVTHNTNLRQLFPSAKVIQVTRYNNQSTVEYRG